VSPHAAYRRAILSAVRDLDKITDETVRAFGRDLKRLRPEILRIMGEQPGRAAAVQTTLDRVGGAVDRWAAAGGGHLRAGMDAVEERARTLTGEWVERVGEFSGDAITPTQIGGMPGGLVGVGKDNIEALKVAAGEHVAQAGDEIKRRVATQARAAALGLISPQEAMSGVAEFIRPIRVPIVRAGMVVGHRHIGVLARAEQIARTEVGRAYTTASQYQQTEIAERIPELRKQWIPVVDGKTRNSHAKMVGKRAIVPVDKPFTVGGASLMHPVDFNGPAHEVVNCRCISVPMLPTQKPQAPVVSDPSPEPAEPKAKRKRRPPAAKLLRRHSSLRKDPSSGRTKRAREQADKLAEGMGNNPEAVAVASLADKLGAKIIMVRAVTDIHPELAGVRPSGWPPGSTWDGVSGMHRGLDGHSVVAVGVDDRMERSVYTAWHELGHAIDNRLADGPGGPYASAINRKLKAAVGELRGKDGPQWAKDAYFRQKGFAGPQETTAEAVQRYATGQLDDLRPKFIQWIEGVFEEHGVKRGKS